MAAAAQTLSHLLISAWCPCLFLSGTKMKIVAA